MIIRIGEMKFRRSHRYLYIKYIDLGTSIVYKRMYLYSREVHVIWPKSQHTTSHQPFHSVMLKRDVTRGRQAQQRLRLPWLTVAHTLFVDGANNITLDPFARALPYAQVHPAVDSDQWLSTAGLGWIGSLIVSVAHPGARNPFNVRSASRYCRTVHMYISASHSRTRIYPFGLRSVRV